MVGTLDLHAVAPSSNPALTTGQDLLLLSLNCFFRIIKSELA